MPNPYPVEITDAEGEARLTGFANFTAPGNQPGVALPSTLHFQSSEPLLDPIITLPFFADGLALTGGFSLLFTNAPASSGVAGTVTSATAATASGLPASGDNFDLSVRLVVTNAAATEAITLQWDVSASPAGGTVTLDFTTTTPTVVHQTGVDLSVVANANVVTAAGGVFTTTWSFAGSWD